MDLKQQSMDEELVLEEDWSCLMRVDLGGKSQDWGAEVVNEMFGVGKEEEKMSTKMSMAKMSMAKKKSQKEQESEESQMSSRVPRRFDGRLL